jgi:hypothetical protein
VGDFLAADLGVFFAAAGDLPFGVAALALGDIAAYPDPPFLAKEELAELFGDNTFVGVFLAAAIFLGDPGRGAFKC